MNKIAVHRRVDRPPEVVFEAIRDFPGYPAYSSFLDAVTRKETEGSGTEYDLRFRWRGLSVDVRTRVVAIEPPRFIEWDVLDDLDARGKWTVSAVADGDTTRLALEIEYDPHSIDSGIVSLPFGLSLDWLRSKAETLARTEARAVLDRIAMDLESDNGNSRPS